MFGCSIPTVAQAAREYHISRSNLKSLQSYLSYPDCQLTGQLKSTIQSLCDQGTNKVEIAKLLKISLRTVFDAIEGVEYRERFEQEGRDNLEEQRRKGKIS